MENLLANINEKVTIKPLKGGKGAIISDMELVVGMLAGQNFGKVQYEIAKELVEIRKENVSLRKEISEFKDFVKATLSTMARQSAATSAEVTMPKLHLPITPSGNPDELRKQIHTAISKLAQLNGHRSLERGFTWTDAYTLFYQRTGYDVKQRGEKYIKGKGTSLLNRIEADNKLPELLSVLRNFLY